MRVDEFGFGFPPRIASFKRGGTLYSINAIPFGGFVRIYGEDGGHPETSGSFEHGTFLQRSAVIVAGVVMNFVFAAILLILVNFLGLRVGIFDEETALRARDARVQILQVSPDSPADAAGLMPLDSIVGFRVNGSVQTVDGPEDVQEVAYSNVGEEVTIVIQRGSELRDFPLTLRTPGPGEGPIGISLALTGVVSYPWYESLWRGVADAGMLFASVLNGYWQIIATLFSDGRLDSGVSGPIGIAALTGQAAKVGFNYFMQFIAMISVNLAVLNIIPFPALDGGRLFLLIAERLRGRPLSRSTEQAINAAGFIVLILLMVAVTARDIVRFF
jgi:regulator of sigma E protease